MFCTASAPEALVPAAQPRLGLQGEAKVWWQEVMGCHYKATDAAR